MQFKLDENLPASAGTILLAAGHGVATAAGEGLAGAPDERIMAVCTEEARVLVTLDLDFADIRSYPPSQHRGILVLRLERQDAVSIRNALQRCVLRFGTEELDRRLWIVEASRIRIRGDTEDS